MIDFTDVPPEVNTAKRNFFDTVVTVKDRGSLVRNPGKFARIIRRDNDGNEIHFTKREKATISNYGLVHAFRIKTRLAPGCTDRWMVWVSYAPSMISHSQELKELRKARVRAARDRKTTPGEAAA